MKIQELADRWGVHYNTARKIVKQEYLANKRNWVQEKIIVPDRLVFLYEKTHNVPEKEDRLTAKEVAEILGVSVKTVYSWVYSKSIEYGTIGDRLVFSRKKILGGLNDNHKQ